MQMYQIQQIQIFEEVMNSHDNEQLQIAMEIISLKKNNNWQIERP